MLLLFYVPVTEYNVQGDGELPVRTGRLGFIGVVYETTRTRAAAIELHQASFRTFHAERRRLSLR